MPRTSPLPDRLWSKVTRGGDDECWPFNGAIGAKGYGTIGAGPGRPRRILSAHRVAYELVYGPIPEGMVLRHTCDNKVCCNPRHLIAGTHYENVQDAMDRGRYPKGANHHCAKVTTEQLAAIIADPRKQKEIALEYGLSQGYVSRLKKGWSRTGEVLN